MTNQFATWCFENVYSESTSVRRTAFSDECAFHISRISGNQNARFCLSDSPRLIKKHEDTTKKITGWIAIHFSGVLDPY